jgi:hypothetical protein
MNPVFSSLSRKDAFARARRTSVAQQRTLRQSTVNREEVDKHQKPTFLVEVVRAAHDFWEVRLLIHGAAARSFGGLMQRMQAWKAPIRQLLTVALYYLISVSYLSNQEGWPGRTNYVDL